MYLRQKTRWVSIGVALALGLLACGGSSSASTTGASETIAATGSTDATATAGSTETTSTTAPAATSDIGPLNTAVVTIGDDVYEFTGVQCSIFTAKYIQAGNFGDDPEVSIVLPPEGWESQGDTFGPPSVRVQVGDSPTGQLWVAGDDGSPAITPIPDGASTIDSYTVPDGRPVKATGTATFIDLTAHNSGQDAPSISGSFEVICP